MAPNQFGTCGKTRRSFLSDTGMGLTGLALGGLLFKDGIASNVTADEIAGGSDGTHHVAKAKSVI